MQDEVFTRLRFCHSNLACPRVRPLGPCPDDCRAARGKRRALGRPAVGGVDDDAGQKPPIRFDVPGDGKNLRWQTSLPAVPGRGRR